MKYTKLIAAFTCLIALSSCNKDDDSVFDARNVKPVVSANATSFSVTEGDVITVTLTTDTPYKKDMDFKLELVGGSANYADYTCSGTETTEGDGFGLIGHMLVFPAYATTTTFTITPKFDNLPESTENFIFKLSSERNGLGSVAESSSTITVSAANKTSQDLNIVLDFSGAKPNRHGNIENATYLNNAATPVKKEFCGIDFDLEVYDNLGNVVDASYSDCPEALTLPASTPNGTYYVVSTFYSMNGAANLTTPKSVLIPLVLTVAKPGIFVDTYDKSGRYSTTSPVFPAASSFLDLREIVKSGSTWTVKDYNTGDVIVSGRQAQGSSIRERIIAKAIARRK